LYLTQLIPSVNLKKLIDIFLLKIINDIAEIAIIIAEINSSYFSLEMVISFL